MRCRGRRRQRRGAEALDQVEQDCHRWLVRDLVAGQVARRKKGDQPADNQVTEFSTAEVLKEDCAPAGFRLTIDTMPASKYWEQWTEVALGITQWAHRPLGTMALGLAYISDASGQPVAWNETRWVDKEFNALYEQASGTYDVNARREIMCKLQTIQMERGSIGIPYWMNFWSLHNKKFRDVPPSPIDLWHFDASWLEA